MGAKISNEHSEEELAALEQAEAAVLQHYEVQDKLKEVRLPLSEVAPELGVSHVRLWQYGPDDGKPVLFVHGGGGNGADFVGLLPSLITAKSKPHRLLFLERPGSGRSNPYDFSNCELDQFYVQFIDAVLGALKIAGENKKVHLVGNSMGGCICVWYALAHPGKVQSLSLVGVPVGFTGMKVPFMFHVLASWIGKQMMAQPPPRSLAVDLFENHFHSDMTRVPDVVIDYLWTSQKTRNNSLSFQSLLTRIIPSIVGRERPFEWKVESLAELKFPCQLVVGSQDLDFATVDKQQAMERFLGGKRYVVGQGHLPWLEDPDGVAKALVDLWK